MIEIIYKDEYIVAVNKPAGLLVHRTNFAEEEKDFLLQKVRNQIRQRVYPVHRLDRQTSGIILFALTPEVAAILSESFKTDQIQKQYYCIGRGHMKESIDLDYAIKNERNNKRIEARTLFTPIQHIELPIPTGPYDTSRYTLIEAVPKTGRWHQIRQHLGHLRHYIIGDKRHGDHRHNKTWVNELDCPFMMLHAKKIVFPHPESKESMTLTAEFPEHWKSIFERFGWQTTNK
jgi:tRNA pseudouridine65 synthase